MRRDVALDRSPAPSPPPMPPESSPDAKANRGHSAASAPPSSNASVHQISARLAHELWLLAGRSATRRFRHALREPRAAQEVKLGQILARNADCEFGRRHGFARIRAVRQYQESVPIRRYAEFEPWIEQMKAGRDRVLTGDPVLMFEKTSGSSSGAKYIPYTSALRSEFMAAVQPWMRDLYRGRPSLMTGGAYWSISPAAGLRERTEGGTPIGFSEDAEYFSPLERWILRRILVVPGEIAQVPDIEASRYITLRFLLADRRLAFVSVWNPSFLTLLIAALSEHVERLVHDIARGTLTVPSSTRETPAVGRSSAAGAATPPRGEIGRATLSDELHARLSRGLRPDPARARELEQALKTCIGAGSTSAPGSVDLTPVWPNLQVVSCWGDASAALFLPQMRSHLPRVTVQTKGLLATEGVVSIPLWGQPAPVAAVTSHFLEFVDDRGQVALVDELQVGGAYDVVLTTSGGLYRYALGDRVTVVGHLLRTPLLRFVGRQSQVSDLCGEKLSDAEAAAAFDEVFRSLDVTPAFALLAPRWADPPRYVAYIECEDGASRLGAVLVDRLERELRRAHHYDYCRRLGQLAPIEVTRVRDGASRYLSRCVQLGTKAGDVKPVALRPELDWGVWLAGVGDARV